MNASIIIPTRNRRTHVLALLASITYAAGDNPAEIVVVDDGSTDDTAEAVRDHFPTVRVVLLSESAGPSAARNRGAREARGDLFLFLDADGEVGAGWLDAMLACADPDTVLLGNVVDFRTGRVQSVPRRATFLGKSLRCRPGRANTGPSCNLGVPRAIFEALEGFDEELPYYFEDSDLCIRARTAGYRFRFVQGATFLHHGSECKTGDAIRLQERNSTYAMLKHYEDDATRMAAFAAANTAWMVLRFVAWSLRGHQNDARRLARGWKEGMGRFFGPRI